LRSVREATSGHHSDEDIDAEDAAIVEDPAAHAPQTCEPARIHNRSRPKGAGARSSSVLESQRSFPSTFLTCLLWPLSSSTYVEQILFHCLPALLRFSYFTWGTLIPPVYSIADCIRLFALSESCARSLYKYEHHQRAPSSLSTSRACSGPHELAVIKSQPGTAATTVSNTMEGHPGFSAKSIRLRHTFPRGANGPTTHRHWQPARVYKGDEAYTGQTSRA